MIRSARNLLLASLSLVASFTLLAPTPSTAEVTRFEITAREPLAEGRPFGDVGPYERIEGKVYFEIDPNQPQNQPIVDLQYAPRNERGRVEFSSDLFLLAPRDLARGNHAVLYDVNNRGNKLALRFFNDALGGNNPRDAGNGFLMRQGYTIVWSGWDGELTRGNARLLLTAPVASDGKQPIAGLVRYEILTNERGKTRLEINGENHGAYRPTAAGMQEATLTWRLRSGDPRVPIPRAQFQLYVLDDESLPTGQLPRIELELPAGFQPGYLYELIYEARDPLVHGVCFAAVRDLIAACKHAEGKNNPLLVDGQAVIEYAHGFGVSQSGRFLREMVYMGFNQDEQGRPVFDGLLPHVAGGGLGSFNHRFAQPTAYGTQHQNYDWPTDRFPFAYEMQHDPLSGRDDGILQRATAAGAAPRVIHTQSATEYWSRAGSLVHTDPLGIRDAQLPDNVRVFAFGGTQHGPSTFPPSAGIGQTLANPADYRPYLRALLVALDRWCRDGQPAPPSVYPTIAGGTLVDWQQASTGFPAIPGVHYPDVIRQPTLLDLGPRWLNDGIADIQPPRPAGEYRVLVPKCDADGNELGCLLPPEVAVPLATFTGWSLRAREPGAENELVGLNGSYIPLPATDQERNAAGDPRRSLKSRYGSVEQYDHELAAYCRQRVAEQLLLAEDVDQIVQRQSARAQNRFPSFGESK